MSDPKAIIKKFITTCTVSFKAFDYRCELSKSTATIWNFVASSPNGEKVYAVYCAPRLEKARSLIKIAKKKMKGNMRLVVVTQSHTDEELENSREDGYALVAIDTLNKYGEEMIEIRAKEAEATEDINPLASSREKVF